MRQIVLDTETTGLEPEQGHRIIEIGCVELNNRRRTGRQYHQYLNPERDIDAGATEVHGITLERLADEPRFADVAEEFLSFIRGAELIIHNAPFDVGFINHEFALLGASWGQLADHCTVIDTLVSARQMHPGQRNSLDALCKRYSVDNSQRQWHGALLDAEILADVYLAMTGGQATLELLENLESTPRTRIDDTLSVVQRSNRPPLRVVTATAAELEAHEQRLAAIQKDSGGQCVWLRGSPPATP